MRVLLGHDAFKAKNNEKLPIYWDSEKAVNGHILLMGGSGMGKTHTIRRIIKDMIQGESVNDLRVHVFDVHGDIELGMGESVVRYSESSNYGINPLSLNDDPHEGGVRKRIQSIIRIIKRTSFVMGDKQEAVLRNLLSDVFEARGFYANNPDTWVAEDQVSVKADAHTEDGKLFLEVPFDQKDQAKACGARWDKDERAWFVSINDYVEGSEITRWAPRGTHIRSYPTFSDVVDYTNKKIRESFLGVGRPAMEALNDFNKATARFNSFLAKRHKSGDLAKLTEAEEKQLIDLQDKVLAAVESYMDKAKGTQELEDLIRYSSIDVLKSVGEKLDNINACGIFKSSKPPFDKNSIIHRHHIKSLLADEQKMFVLFSLERIFEFAMRRGVSDRIRDVIVIDEAAKFFDDDENNILNIIAREARKFGVSLVCASQSPTHFSEDFITSVGTKIVLGIDESFWDSSSRKLRIDVDKMKYIQAKVKMMAQIKEAGTTSSPWRDIAINMMM